MIPWLYMKRRRWTWLPCDALCRLYRPQKAAIRALGGCDRCCIQHTLWPCIKEQKRDPRQIDDPRLQ